MISSFLRKAAWLFGAVLVVAGVVLILNLFALLFWQFGIVDPVLALLPAAPPAWLTSLHIAMVVALLGAALASLGFLIARGQTARIRVDKERVEDRMRRRHQYRADARVEPFIGPGMDAGVDEPPRRRVA